jgi:AraC-like DNA-binding protein
MAHVSAFFVARMIEQAMASIPPERLGPHTRGDLYRVAGLPEDGMPGEGTPDMWLMMPDTNYHAVLVAIAALETPDVSFHLRTASAFRCDDFGAVGLAWKAAPNLRASFSRMNRYTRLYNTAAAFGLEERGDEIWWVHKRQTPPRTGLYLSNEGAMATYVALCREATSEEFAPLRLQFHHSELGSIRAAEAYFRCPIDYDREVDALIMPASLLDEPNSVGDESIWRFLTAQVEETLPPEDDEAAGAAAPAGRGSARQGTDKSLRRAVMKQVTDVLSDGVPGIADIASSLAMSPRTLQRRLAEEDCTFQAVVDEARHGLATRLLSETPYSLAEIAFLTGFSEQSAFTRAFKRREAQTPGAYRATHAGG